MNTQKATEKFITHSKIKHNNKYTYEKTVYTGSNNTVIITCLIHGDFFQIAHSHLAGHGCKQCQISKQRKSLLYFITEANIIHNNRYLYNNFIYSKNNSKSFITCLIHGDFLQSPQNHLKGKWCPICANIKNSKRQTYTKEDFIVLANNIHNNHYHYNQLVYTGINNKGIITCPIHGNFEQRLSNHLQGRGCHICCSSNGERLIEKFLIDNHVNYKKQKKFSNCRYKSPLSFDFYIPQFNLLIEFQGEQHYYIIPRSKSNEKNIKNFTLGKYRDQIKRDWCKNNNYTLLEIPYWEKNRINEILISYLA